uniref:NIMA interactive protein n=1 Tax=Bionectria ochroleuca TaxID=29856 RepID=A0A8H7N4B1_BIOOC
MIDTDNLRTASLYINNQLLSRGLLKDGQSIDFSNPERVDGDIAPTMGRIMSVVNDLILRRDRDAEHRESLSATMRSLRAENLKLANDVSRLSEKCAESQRKLDIAEASETSVRTQLKSAESVNRGLKDDLARTKALVTQARTACATEVRRRDRQIETLKKQVGEAGRARGSRTNSAITTITVTGDFGADTTTRTVAAAGEGYSLRSETNAFLADLAQNLSEENEQILGAMRKAMGRLREMSGWENGQADGHVTRAQGWEDMAPELDSVLEHMKTILSNPSFVPIEEVVVREEEINRLKDGWVKMESRWTEAVHLIESWRKRMAASGRPVCDEELKMGLRLSPVRVKNVAETRHAGAFGLSAVAEEQEEEQDEPEEVQEVYHAQQSPTPYRNGVPGPMEQGQEDVQADDLSEDDLEEDDFYEDYDEEEPNVEILQQSVAMPSWREASPDSPPIPEPPRLSPLRNSPSAGNRGNPTRKTREKPGDFTTIAEENTWDLEQEQTGHRDKRVKKTPTKDEEQEKPHRSPVRTSLDDALLGKLEEDATQENSNSTGSSSRGSDRQGTENLSAKTPRRGISRLPLPRNAEAGAQQSPLTMANIAAKLAASEKEADAARVRAKLKAVRGARGVQRPTSTVLETSSSENKKSETENVDPVKQDPAAQAPRQELKVEKRERRKSKVASRRRSTLSPWELETLITVPPQ